MERKTVIMDLAKTTAGTYVYQEDPTKPRDERVFPTVYVQKSAVGSQPPRRIRVTIEEATS